MIAYKYIYTEQEWSEIRPHKTTQSPKYTHTHTKNTKIILGLPQYVASQTSDSIFLLKIPKTYNLLTILTTHLNERERVIVCVIYKTNIA